MVKLQIYCVLKSVKPKSVIRKQKTRSNCRIVQRTGISPAPYPCSAYPSCAKEWQRFPLATERGRSILHYYSIVIASLLEMLTENNPGSRQHRAEIERPKWVYQHGACRWEFCLCLWDSCWFYPGQWSWYHCGPSVVRLSSEMLTTASGLLTQIGH